MERQRGEAGMTGRFVLLDRDGTINVEREYLSDPAGVVLLPNAAAGLRRLRALGFGLIVISNQSGVARGYFKAADVDAVNARLAALLRAEDVVLDGIYICPHAPDAGCACRKPAPGLVLEAARQHGFDPRLAIMIGDKALDIETGRRVGARTVLVRTGYGRAVEAQGEPRPDYVADDLLDAASAISRWVPEGAAGARG
jgi:D-glycero-D-manno-heptose 1,7-bisphosphate phosphatase